MAAIRERAQRHRRPAIGPPPDVLTIAGTAIDMVARNVTLDRMTTFARGGTPQLGFARLVGTPGALPDPWNLKSCTLTMQDTLVFSGIVTGYVDRLTRGWAGCAVPGGWAWGSPATMCPSPTARP